MLKKLLVLFIVVSGIAKQAMGQTYVTIPDANFVTYLQNNIPAAMNGNQMNTSSTLVTTMTYMDCSNLSIANLSGIQYFTSLINLSCYQNSLTSLPALPTSLKYLVCYQNSLTSLPALPASLTYLYCSNNQLTSIPALSNTCKGLYCDLYCDYNNLTSLPVLPDSLNQLVCNNNNISCFPTFPISINRYSGPGSIPFSIYPNPYNCLPNYILPAMNSYTVTPLCATGNSNGCTVTDISQYSSLNTQIAIYPNPSNGSFVIEPNAAAKQSIMVYDVTGKMVLSQTINGKTTIDAGSLNEGVYNISINSNEGTINKRLVIAK